MESSEDVEVLSRAIDEKRKREAAGDAFMEDHDDQLLLSVGITKDEGRNRWDNQRRRREGDRRLEESLEEIAKDIKNVKRQNTITHVLLSAMIFLTLAWQLSEYSMIFMTKQRISHPIRSIGSMLNGMFKGKLRPIKSQLTGTSTSKEQDNNGNGTNTGAPLQTPELLRFDGDDEE